MLIGAADFQAAQDEVLEEPDGLERQDAEERRRARKEKKAKKRAAKEKRRAEKKRKHQRDRYATVSALQPTAYQRVMSQVCNSFVKSQVALVGVIKLPLQMICISDTALNP